MIRLPLFVCLLAALVSSYAAQDPDLLRPYRKVAKETWKSSIAALEARDRAEPDPAGAILFVGSSSIRLWDTIARDMAPWPVVQRGFGGARTSDVAVFSERLLHPHEYRALVLFIANDVAGQANDLAPGEVAALLRYLREVSLQHRPDAPIFLIEVTPTRSRWKHWPRIREINQTLRELALTTPNLWFISTAEHYLNDAKQPREELFVEDLLHLNEAGYAQWAKLIRRRLTDVLKAP